MAIIATIPHGMTSVTVSGLHQWDYGQTLEIHTSGLPDQVEVHFACAGMSEAVVRTCTVRNGVVHASIPDVCLEKATPVEAWLFAVSANSGRTLARIILQVEARVRPAAATTTI